MQIAIERWGEPHYVNKSEWNGIKREQWVYNCLKYPECYDDSECFFEGPCYILYFEDSQIIDVYDGSWD